MSVRSCLGLLTCSVLLVACGGGGGGGGGAAAPTTYRIEGTLSGDVIAGVLVVLTGDSSASVYTGADGSYAFTGLSDGAYTVTPSDPNCTFTPSSRAVTLAGADAPAADFTVAATPSTLNVAPPTATLRLVFIHHSCGSNWLSTGDGDLGDALDANNYYVRDTNYGWDAPNNPDIGSSTDIGHWYTWFADPATRGDITGALYATGSKTVSYATTAPDPGGENDIVMFKSCYPNSNVLTDNAEPPQNLYGQSAGSAAHTLSNCREVYRQILAYFRTRPDKMFVVITAPPLVSSSTDASMAANARTLNDWLVDGWLSEAGWMDRNVYVFDFYNVLTDAANHHRVNGGAIEHVSSFGDDFSAYGQGGDSHPSAAGNQKATAEFVPLLNASFHLWQQWLGNE